MTDLLAQAPAFIAGYVVCLLFIGLAEWLTAVRPDPMAEPYGDCPWPQADEIHPVHSATTIPEHQ